MAFFEVEFPRKLALNATGGPGYSTQVNAGFSGYEQRNQNWAQSRGKWQVSFENKSQAEYQQLLGFFHAVRGQANAFRLLDPSDYFVQGQYIATGDGSKQDFQFQRTYYFPVTASKVIRPIQKLVTSKVKDYQGNYLLDTITVYDNGTPVTHAAGYAPGGAFTVDETTGNLHFPTPPAAGHIITADFNYHWPVRFEMDQLQTQYITPRAGAGPLITVAGMALLEVRIPIGSAS